MATLFDRTQIGTLRLKNRIFMSPMGTGAGAEGGFSPMAREYYTARAKGGFGMIIFGRTACNTKYEPGPSNVLENYSQLEKLYDLVEALHSYGTKACLQASAGNGRMSFTDPHTPAYAPSAVPSAHFPDIICKPLTIDNIKEIEEKIGRTAALAKEAGIDAIELQGYGGYLIDQFMTDLWNRREDEYGGSFENRMRFPLNLIRQIKRSCGEDFPVLFKFTIAHHIDGGRDIEEGLKIARLLEAAGVSALQVDHGCNECLWNAIPTVYDPDGSKISLVEEVKKIVNIPVFCDGKLGEPGITLKAVEDGRIDYVALGKQAVADPEWPNKMEGHRYDEIRHCIYCNECMLGILSGRHIACSINPLAGFEKTFSIEPARSPKNVLVIGGGPGGMQCAMTLAERGHKVTLAEKSRRLGGNVVAAAAPEFKGAVRRYLGYLVSRIEKSSVEVLLEKQFTADEILGLNADAVILATGATSIVPNVDGIESGKVGTAIEFLKGEKAVGEKVAVIGAGLVGCETALSLEKNGRKVILVEQFDKIIPREVIPKNNSRLLEKMISESTVDVRLNTRFESIGDGYIVLTKGEISERIPCDDVLMAVGMRPENSLENQLQGQIDHLFVIGDCEKPRKIWDAVHEGFHVARVLE